MTAVWPKDVHRLHEKQHLHSVVDNMSDEELREFLEFRANFLEEEMNEMRLAMLECRAEDVVDAIIDWIVVGIGTLDAFRVRVHQAWDEVHDKNMEKEPGSNPNRPNKFGFPDLIKPHGWTPPSHEGNVGLIKRALSVKRPIERLAEVMNEPNDAPREEGQ